MSDENKKNPTPPEKPAPEKRKKTRDAKTNKGAMDSSGVLPAQGEGVSPPPKKRHRVRNIVLICLGAVLLATGVAVAVNINTILKNPEKLFADSFATVPSVKGTPLPEGEEGTEPSRTEIPQEEDEMTLEELEALADFDFVPQYSQLKGKIVNILLIGVDYAEERVNNPDGLYRNKDFNADVMMLLAVDFDNKQATLLSVPRDTFSGIPGGKAPYKLNFSLTFGGGMNHEGYMKVCESVKWMLGGGIPVDYYIAVTMPAVKKLGNAVGGIEFNVDMPFTIQGRSYKAGWQKLDGQGILDYCRTRKNIGIASEEGDANRVNRQKEVLFQVFKKLQRSNKLLTLPQLLIDMSEDVKTNLTFSQLAAVAVIGYQIDPNDVELESFIGTHTMVYNFGYVLTNQSHRVKLIEQVYGVKVPQYRDYQPDVVRTKWFITLAEHYIELVEPSVNKDLSLGESSKISPQRLQELTELIASGREMIETGNDYLDQKPKVATNWKLLEEFTAALRAKATAYFQGTGYSVGSWYYDVYKDITPKMKE